MGMPAMQGDPAESAAETPAKSFPADTDPASITMLSGVAGDPVMVGTPRQAEARMTDRPIEEMGLGFREVTGGVN